MKRRSFITSIAFFLGIFYLTGFPLAAEEKTEKLKVISKVVNVSTLLGLRPSTLISKQGTTVIWVNHSSIPVEILFLDKKVVSICGVPVNFFIGKNGAYESSKIPFGGIASLCFIERGKHEYVFKVSSTFYPFEDKEHRGVIWIK